LSRAALLRDRFGAWLGSVYRAQSNEFYSLLGYTLFLVAFGVVMVLSASSIDSLIANDNSLTTGLRQFVFAIGGLLAMSFLSILPVSFFRKRSEAFMRITLVIQLLVFFVGTEVNGNRNWIQIPILGFAIQPSEFLKLAIIIALAAHLSTNVDYLHDPQTWKKPFVLIVIALGLVMLGRDLGTAIVMVLAFFGLMILAGLPNRLIAYSGIAITVLGIGALMASGSRRGRILAWLNPDAPDPNGYLWQSEHGEWAIAAGRLFGVGLGESKMKWSWIPEVENDFIFAIVAEEFGLIGALVVIVIFILMARSFVRILNKTQDYFARYIIYGVMIWIIFQALVNIAVVLRLLPVLGVPLPLISAGGSSMLATLMGVGVVLSIERSNHQSPARTKPKPRGRR